MTTQLVQFGTGRILIRKMFDDSQGQFLGFSVLEEPAQINKPIKVSTNDDPPVLMFRFTKISSIDALINKLLECRSGLSKEPMTEEAPSAEELTFLEYLTTNYHYYVETGEWRSKEGDVHHTIQQIYKSFKSIV